MNMKDLLYIYGSYKATSIGSNGNRTRNSNAGLFIGVIVATLLIAALFYFFGGYMGTILKGIFVLVVVGWVLKWLSLALMGISSMLIGSSNRKNKQIKSGSGL